MNQTETPLKDWKQRFRDFVTHCAVIAAAAFVLGAGVMHVFKSDPQVARVAREAVEKDLNGAEGTAGFDPGLKTDSEVRPPRSLAARMIVTSTTTCTSVT